MTTKLFVGNLSFETTQGDLENLFSEVGELVEVFLPSDRNTGRPRGFAFVEFKDAAVIPAAIEKFDGFELDGRTLRVNEAEARPPRPSFGGGGGRPGGGGGFTGKKPKPKGSRRNIRRRKRSI